jgi:hypothetical protein
MRSRKRSTKVTKEVRLANGRHERYKTHVKTCRLVLILKPTVLGANDGFGVQEAWRRVSHVPTWLLHLLNPDSYTTDKKDKEDSQKNLDKWTDEDWQTKDGSGNAKQEDGTEKRYLPKKAWEQMSEKEKKETDEKKLAESKEGKQYVSNTEKAKDSRKKANEENEEQNNENVADEDGINDEEDEDDEYNEEDRNEENENEGGDRRSDEENKAEKQSKKGTKRGRGQASQNGANKSQKTNSGDGQQTVGSKHDKAEPPAAQGSNDRLPEKGQKVVWKALPGWVNGELVEIVYEEKDVQGKHVKGTKEDPRLVLKSDSSGKICVHKPDAVYFD